MLRLAPRATVVGIDFAIPMIRAGMAARKALPLRWCLADALALPFPDDCFDAVLSAFLLRNAVSLERAIAVLPHGNDMRRLVEVAGGGAAVLDAHPLAGVVRHVKAETAGIAVQLHALLLDLALDLHALRPGLRLAESDVRPERVLELAEPESAKGDDKGGPDDMSAFHLFFSIVSRRRSSRHM